MTDLPKAALYGFDLRTSGAWLWFADNLDFEVAAVAAPEHEIESVRRLAADLEAPLYSSLEALFEDAELDVLLVTQPLEEARRATAYGLDHGVRVHTEIVPATIRRSTGAIAAFGIDPADVGALITVGGRRRLAHLALADCDRDEVRDLAGALGATAHGSLVDMVEAGGFAELYLSSPWSVAQEAIDYLSDRGIRVIGDFLPPSAGHPAGGQH